MQCRSCGDEVLWRMKLEGKTKAYDLDFENHLIKNGFGTFLEKSVSGKLRAEEKTK